VHPFSAVHCWPWSTIWRGGGRGAFSSRWQRWHWGQRPVSGAPTAGTVWAVVGRRVRHAAGCPRAGVRAAAAGAACGAALKPALWVLVPVLLREWEGPVETLHPPPPTLPLPLPLPLPASQPLAPCSPSPWPSGGAPGSSFWLHREASWKLPSPGMLSPALPKRASGPPPALPQSVYRRMTSCEALLQQPLPLPLPQATLERRPEDSTWVYLGTTSLLPLPLLSRGWGVPIPSPAPGLSMHHALLLSVGGPRAHPDLSRSCR